MNVGIDSYNVDADTLHGNELPYKSAREEMEYISNNHYKPTLLCINPLKFSKNQWKNDRNLKITYLGCKIAPTGNSY